MGLEIRHFGVGALFAGLAALASGCVSSCLPEKGPADDVFTQPLTTDLRALDPAVAYDQASWEIIPNLYEPLFQYGYLQDPFRLEPLLAADQPELSDDRRTVTIQIQRGVRFHADASIGGGAEGRELSA